MYVFNLNYLRKFIGDLTTNIFWISKRQNFSSVQTQPVGFGNPAYLQACLAGP